MRIFAFFCLILCIGTAYTNYHVRDFAFKGRVKRCVISTFGYPKGKGRFLENREEYHFSREGLLIKSIAHSNDNTRVTSYSTYTYLDLNWCIVSNFMENGNLSSYQKVYFNADLKVTQAESYFNGVNTFKDCYVYDRYGKIIRREHGNAERTWISVIDRVYDERGNQIQEVHYSTEYRYVYNENNQISEWSSVYKNETNYHLNTYDQNGRQIRESLNIKNPEAQNYRNFYYDSNGNLSYTKRYDNHNRLFQTILYRYDKENNMTDIVLYGDFFMHEEVADRLKKTYVIRYRFEYW